MLPILTGSSKEKHSFQYGNKIQIWTSSIKSSRLNTKRTNVLKSSESKCETETCVTVKKYVGVFSRSSKVQSYIRTLTGF